MVYLSCCDEIKVPSFSCFRRYLAYLSGCPEVPGEAQMLFFIYCACLYVFNESIAAPLCTYKWVGVAVCTSTNYCIQPQRAKNSLYRGSILTLYSTQMLFLIYCACLYVFNESIAALLCTYKCIGVAVGTSTNYCIYSQKWPFFDRWSGNVHERNIYSPPVNSM